MAGTLSTETLFNVIEKLWRKLIVQYMYHLLASAAMFKKSFCRASGLLLLLGGGLFFSCGIAHAQTTESISTEATSVLLSRTKDFLKENNSEDLLPYLREILVRVRGMKDKGSIETRSFCMYQIGVCELQLKRYSDAIESFDLFLNEFPEDSRVGAASLMVSEAYAMSANWAGAEKYASKMLNSGKVSDARRMNALTLLGEALYHQEKWKDATAPLREVFHSSEKQEDRNAAAIMLVTCYVKERDFDNFMKFLSFCDDSVRQSASLNIALIEAGDFKVKEKDYADALVLYRKVLRADERVALYRKQIAELETAIAEPYKGTVGSSRSAHNALIAKKQKQLGQKKKELEFLLSGKGYDQELEIRIGQCYVGMKRNWPAYTLYRRLYTDHPKSALAEDARFHAFSVMLDMQKWDGALEEGSAYLERYPTGKFAEEVSLNQMQVYIQTGKLEEAQALGFKSLKLLPQHRFADQIKYLIGYIYFQKIEYSDALKTFKEVYEKWPDSIYHEASDYWIAMSYLFLGQFEDAVNAFTGYLENKAYTQRRFEEDASYRLGIALYGAGRFDDSEMVFRRFLEKFPGSNLESEAYSMVGDLRGADGALDDALVYYNKALESAISIDQINYAIFQSAKTYELQGRYQDIIKMMEKYLVDEGEKGNFAGAGFWIGKSYKALGQDDKALEKYIETVVRFGDKLENEDVDLILRELIKEHQKDGGWANEQEVMNRLKLELNRAKGKSQITLVLRLQTLFSYITEGRQHEKYIQAVLSEGNVENAGPLTLLLIATEALKKGDYKLVHETYQHCMKAYSESDILIDVMNIELQTLFDEGEYTKVQDLAEEITNRFGYRDEVGLTRKLKADAYRLTNQYDLAIKTYKELFAVREWRGPLTPQALYWIGICKFDQGDVKEAFAFFQRVYVMYEGYTEWVAKAYEGSILCLEKMGGRTEDIISTCEEMLSKEAIAATPEGVRARARLAKLRPQGEGDKQ